MSTRHLTRLVLPPGTFARLPSGERRLETAENFEMATGRRSPVVALRGVPGVPPGINGVRELRRLETRPDGRDARHKRSKSRYAAGVTAGADFTGSWSG